MNRWRNGKMEATDEKYFECPVCSFIISFKFDYDKYIYVSTCPYCMNRIEMDKDEFEIDDEIYFEKDF